MAVLQGHWEVQLWVQQGQREPVVATGLRVLVQMAVLGLLYLLTH